MLVMLWFGCRWCCFTRKNQQSSPWLNLFTYSVISNASYTFLSYCLPTALQGSPSWVVATPLSDPFLVSYHFHAAFGCASFFHLRQSLMGISITTDIILIHPFSHQHTCWGVQQGAHCVTPQAWPNIILVLGIGGSLFLHLWCLSLDAPPMTLLLSNPWWKWCMAHNSDRRTQNKCYNSIFNHHNQHTASIHQPLAHSSNYHWVPIINSKLMILSFLRYIYSILCRNYFVVYVNSKCKK